MRVFGESIFARMRKYHIIPLLLFAALTLHSCQGKKPKSPKQSGKWLNYIEVAAHKEQQLLRERRVVEREARTRVVTDTGTVHYTSEIAQYNRFGLPTLIQQMDLAGTVTKETRYEYQDSLLLREFVKESNGQSTATHYQYNARGHKIAEFLFAHGDSVMRSDYTLDPSGNEIDVRVQDYKRHTVVQRHTTRDTMGRPQQVQELQDGKVQWTERYEISESLWHIHRSDAAGKLESDYEMLFDENGAIIELLNRGPEGKTRMRVVFENDDEGRILKEQFWDGEGKALQSTESTYGDEGFILDQKFTAPSLAQPTMTFFAYTFLD